MKTFQTNSCIICGGFVRYPYHTIQTDLIVVCDLCGREVFKNINDMQSCIIHCWFKQLELVK